ncbi:MAG: hypothetical protein ABIO38_09660 [Luteimonas sp.]
MWDAFQREMLAALGHTLYVPAGTPAMRVQEEAVGARASGRDARESDASGNRAQHRNARPPHAIAPDALMRALLRAANLGVNEAAMVQAQVPQLRALSGDAAAKRKLWPALRTMRAQRRT